MQKINLRSRVINVCHTKNLEQRKRSYCLFPREKKFFSSLFRGFCPNVKNMVNIQGKKEPIFSWKAILEISGTYSLELRVKSEEEKEPSREIRVKRGSMLLFREFILVLKLKYHMISS